MKLYKCDHCDYETPYRCNLENHKKRKVPCYISDSNSESTIESNHLTSVVKDLITKVQILEEENKKIKEEVVNLRQDNLKLSLKIFDIKKQLNPSSPVEFIIEDETSKE
jgi:hypothetical protein